MCNFQKENTIPIKTLQKNETLMAFCSKTQKHSSTTGLV